ncbi:MAG: ATP-grasp domain-containing protein [Candidatus Cloacimonadota bacterium]|jgi:biotin carboxylase|nr:ATP-grasp domain-containing protein [Candidatus Cloacimonadota bacterium]
MKKLAIIGASYLQKPLVLKARELGYETFVFAWEDGAVCKGIADHFMPISILEKEEILRECMRIKIDGITSIGSDLAMPTVNYIADKMSLVGNSLDCTRVSTNKYQMRTKLSSEGVACPRFVLYTGGYLNDVKDLSFPVIVKPIDRSGSLGVTKVETMDHLENAVHKAKSISLTGQVIIEEFIEGREFSVEFISYQGIHHYLTITDKVTTNEPYFVEIAHHQPADISRDVEKRIISEVKKALDALGIKNGASHSEVKITKEGIIRVIEIAGRMGGELIGSDMVENSTGYDFVKGVIDVALGQFDNSAVEKLITRYSGVYYVIPNSGVIYDIVDNSSRFNGITKVEVMCQIGDSIEEVIDGAGKRPAVFVYADDKKRLHFDPNQVIIIKTKQV